MFQAERRFGPRLTMTLCYSSSEDESRPVTALRYQTRASCGWQSAKHCTYPQELGFRFEGLVTLESLRLLAHEFKCTTCVDVAIAEATSEELQKGVCLPYEEANFRSVGHTRFSARDETQRCSRELKSLGIRRQCTYLKLLFHRPHANGYNLFRQVGVAALSAHGLIVRSLTYPPCGNTKVVVVGEVSEVPLDEMMPLTNEETNAAHYDGAPTDATALEDLRRWKARAVAEEDYDLAAKLKSQIEVIECNKPEITRLEIEKRRAVEAEDYVRAKQLKQQIDTLRSQYSFSTDRGTPSGDGGQTPLARARAAAAAAGSNGSHNNNSILAASRAAASAGAPTRPPPPPPRRPLSGPTKTAAHDEVAVGGKGFYDVDGTKEPFSDKSANLGGSQEAEVPQCGGGAPWERELNTTIASFITDKSTPAALTGDAAQEAKAFEKDLGMYCTACLLAKRGQLREAAIRGVVSKSGYRAVASHTTTGVETLLMYLASKGRGVSDPAAGVVFASCEALQKLVVGGLEGEHVPALTQLAGPLAKLSPDLVARLGDPNGRIRENVESVIIAIARSAVGPDRLISMLMADPDKEAKRAVNFRAHLGRVNLLSSFVDVYDVRRSGVAAGSSLHALDTRQLMERVVLPSMQNANSEVREAAAKLFAKLILLNGGIARPFLANIKPAQQAVVEEELARQRAEEPGTPMPRVVPQQAEEAAPSSPPARREVRSSQPQTAPPLQPKQLSPTAELAGESKAVQRPAGKGKDNGSGIGGRPIAALPLPESASSRTEQEFRSSHTCQFCGEFNRNFTESNLDIHYVRACPMLCPCPLCDQVTEICTLQLHLVSECEGMRLVRECPRCHEAVRAEDYKRHVAAQNCIEAVAAFSVCPLCHARFPVGMDGWRQHLAASPGCPNNPRKYDGSGPVML